MSLFTKLNFKINIDGHRLSAIIKTPTKKFKIDLYENKECYLEVGYEYMIIFEGTDSIVQGETSFY